MDYDVSRPMAGGLAGVNSTLERHLLGRKLNTLPAQGEGVEVLMSC